MFRVQPHAVELPATSPFAARCGARCERRGPATHPQGLRSSLLLEIWPAVPHPGRLVPPEWRAVAGCRLASIAMAAGPDLCRLTAVALPQALRGNLFCRPGVGRSHSYQNDMRQ